MKTLIAIAFALSLLAGCAIDSGDPWSSDYDPAWTATTDCYANLGYDTNRVSRPRVVVRDDCRSKWSAQDFEISPGAWVFGYYTPAYTLVQVCPDLKALRHEFSHHVSLGVRGHTGRNAEGLCGL